MNFKSASSILLSAVAVISLCQCKQQSNDAAQVVQPQVSAASTGLKIAYIDVDSLLANYSYYIDLRDEMLRKEENYSLLLAEEREKIEKEIDDFNSKLQKGIFSSEERAKSESNRIAKKQKAFQEKAEKYSNELDELGLSNSQKMTDIITNYLKEFNKDKGYNVILSKASLLLADDSMNITAQVLEGLNAEYNKTNK